MTVQSLSMKRRFKCKFIWVKKILAWKMLWYFVTNMYKLDMVEKDFSADSMSLFMFGTPSSYHRFRYNPATNRYLSQCWLISLAMSCLMTSDHSEWLWLLSRGLLGVWVILIKNWLESLGRDMIDSWVQIRPEPILTQMYFYLYKSTLAEEVIWCHWQETITWANVDVSPCCHMAS